MCSIKIRKKLYSLLLFCGFTKYVSLFNGNFNLVTASLPWGKQSLRTFVISLEKAIKIYVTRKVGLSSSSTC